MYQGHLGKRFPDPNQLENPDRDRTLLEVEHIATLGRLECEMRQFIMSLPHDVDGRCRATALTKLDELVLWTKKGIDA